MVRLQDLPPDSKLRTPLYNIISITIGKYRSTTFFRIFFKNFPDLFYSFLSGNNRTGIYLSFVWVTAAKYSPFFLLCFWKKDQFAVQLFFFNWEGWTFCKSRLFVTKNLVCQLMPNYFAIWRISCRQSWRLSAEKWREKTQRAVFGEDVSEVVLMTSQSYKMLCVNDEAIFSLITELRCG